MYEYGPEIIKGVADGPRDIDASVIEGNKAVKSNNSENGQGKAYNYHGASHRLFQAGELYFIFRACCHNISLLTMLEILSIAITVITVTITMRLATW